MKKVLLTSSGFETERIIEVFRGLFEKNTNEIKALFIPTAATCHNGEGISVLPKCMNDLLKVGITTPEQLREIGTKEAFIRIRTKDLRACIRMLYGVQGAIEGINDKFLSDSTKNELKEFHKSL